MTHSQPGSLRFDKFMSHALYGPHGFYANHGRAGRRGDFLTSPEVGPLFGHVISRYLDGVWESLGHPKTFDLLEVGAGPGTLARSILASDARCLSSLSYVAVEVSAEQRKLHPSGIKSVATTPSDPVNGVVFANELLDNIPFRLFVFDGIWCESYVSETRDGFVEELRPVEDLPSVLPSTAPHGSRVPYQEEARNWVMNALQLLESGRLLTIDYGRQSTEETLNVDWRKWLRTYSLHGRGKHYLREVGKQDITCDVMFDQIFEGVDVHFTSQMDFLEAYGLKDLVEEGRRYWEANASFPDLRTMAMRSRVSEAEALIDPQGLGSFTVAEVVV